MAFFISIMRYRALIYFFACLTIGWLSPNLMGQSHIFKKLEIDIPKNDTTIYLGDWVLEENLEVLLLPDSTIYNDWEFDVTSGVIKIDIENFQSSPEYWIGFLINYEVLPITLPKRIRINERINLIDSDSLDTNTPIPTFNSSRNSIQSDLTQSGSLSRGIIVGSNQDFALESGLNFELAGQLTDNIWLDAVLTDQSIPIQPDGSTQSIREFDKVLIRLNSENASLEMGDVDVSLNQSRFAKLNRRLQGAAGQFSSSTGSVKAALSSVRGTFRTQQFTGLEGVQGPYRLIGKNGEEFIIILAGTERVYLNGTEVKRGEENEYVIDYGLGEIYFTDNVFIKDETRIYIEFEYIDQDFTRTLVAAEAHESFNDGNFKVGVSILRQADGDELLSQQVLNEQDIRILEQVGDDLDNAVVSGVITNPDLDEENVRYALVDTTLNGQTYSIYKNIPGSPSSNLVVRFSNLGEGNGSYRRVGDVINGLLYEWVGPGGGSYEPFRRLPAPQNHQMFALNSDLKLTDKIFWSGEIALSDFDQNRFSGIDNDDNTDIAFETNLNAQSLNIGFADLDLSYQRRQSGNNFEFFERTREIEFDRKWNLESNDISGEILNEVSAVVNFSQNSRISGGVGNLSFNDFNSTNQSSEIVLANSELFNLNYRQEFVSSDNDILNKYGSWFRQIGRIESRINKFLTPFVHFEHEDQRDRNSSNDFLSTSQKFLEVGPGLNFQSDFWEISAAYVLRKESGIIDNSFQDEASAVEQRFELGYDNNRSFSSKNRIHFRNKSFTDRFKQLGNQDRNGFQISSISAFNNDQLSGRITYRANTQRQALRQEAYIEVGPELGQYVWIDENENGLEEIDEFFLELSPNEGTYVLQYLPSDQLLPVIDLETRLNFEWEPFSALNNASNLFKSLRFNTNLNIRENSTTTNESDVYLLKVDTFRNDSTTINGLFRFEQDVEFEPLTNLSFRLGYSSSDQLSRRTTELQAKNGSSMLFDMIYRINRQTHLNLDVIFSSNSVRSDALTNRNYDIRSYSLNPSLTTRISRSLQFTFLGGYSKKADQLNDSSESNILRFTTTTRAYLWKKVETSSRIELRNVNLSGATNSFSRFELTEGTGSGFNIIWSLSANYRVSNLLRLNFTYDGRTVQNRPDIHTLKMVVSAFF